VPQSQKGRKCRERASATAKRFSSTRRGFPSLGFDVAASLNGSLLSQGLKRHAFTRNAKWVEHS
jgi:hypothetical protein